VDREGPPFDEGLSVPGSRVFTRCDMMTAFERCVLLPLGAALLAERLP